MGTRILHFGADEFNRLMVLRSAGYSVEVCSSLPKLDFALHLLENPAAVVMSDLQPAGRRDAVTLVHTHSTAPVILFQHTGYTPDESEFDLVIPNLTPAKEWLEQIAALLETSRALHASSQISRRQSSSLIRQSATTREEAAQERRRSARIRAKAKEILNSKREIPSSGSKAG